MAVERRGEQWTLLWLKKHSWKNWVLDKDERVWRGKGSGARL